MIYLDNSATTPIAPEALQAMQGYRNSGGTNAGSIHRGGQQARVALEENRQTLATALRAEPREIILTSGGTEANNLALKGHAFSLRKRGAEWPTLVIAPTEHQAVLGPAEFLASIGVPVVYAGVDVYGRLLPEELERVLLSLDTASSPPALVSAMLVNNETGAINPVGELASVAHRHGAIVHCDAVQAFGKINISPRELGVDMLTISAHKIHGPVGIGALYVAREIEIEPLLHGGSQERQRRAGTEAVELAAGFAAALDGAIGALTTTTAHLAEIGGYLRYRLAGIEGARCTVDAEHAVPWIVSVTFDDAERLDGQGLIVGMDLEGVAVSNGSACTSGSSQPSHVLAAMGLPEAQARGAVRFSMSRLTCREDIDRGADALERVVARMRRNLIVPR